MSEESRKPGAELTEAALEAISGGASDHPLVDIVKWHVCMCCPYFERYCRDRYRELADYMMRNGYSSDWRSCPFLPKP